MPQQNYEPPAARSTYLTSSIEAGDVFEQIATLRQCVIEAWQGRAITFTSDEQRRLKEEIEETSSLFHDLTMNA